MISGNTSGERTFFGQFHATLPIIKSEVKRVLTASEEKLLNHLQTNRTYNKVFLKRFGNMASDICNTCKVRETNERIIFWCKEYTRFWVKYKWYGKL